MKRPTVVAIFGPTSSGKTDLSLRLIRRLAEARGVEAAIISADSRQVYKYMNIGTNKPPLEIQKAFPHDLIDIREPTQALELWEYQQMALKRIETMHARGQLPLLVGGTGTYILSVIENWDIPRVKPDYGLREELNHLPVTKLYKQLQRADPRSAQTVNKNNRLQIMRALEVLYGTSRSKTTFAKQRPSFDTVLLSPSVPRKALNRRIRENVDRQLSEGLTDEVLSLVRRYGLMSKHAKQGMKQRNQIFKTLGYREYIEHARTRRANLFNLTPRDVSMIAAMIKKDTVAYANRQIAWFNKMKTLTFIPHDDKALLRHIEACL